MRKDCTKTQGWKNAQKRNKKIAAKKREERITKYYISPRKCKVCNTTISYEADIRNVFCSKSCSAKYNNKKRIRHKNVNKLICLFCKSEFTHKKGNLGKYCSMSCSSKHTSAKRKEMWYQGNTTKITRSTIRRYIQEDRGNKCEIDGCGVSSWLNKDIVLIVDHINGDAGDNRPENVRLICPNCNSQTPTFGGRNKGNGRKSRGLPR